MGRACRPALGNVACRLPNPLLLGARPCVQQQVASDHCGKGSAGAAARHLPPPPPPGCWARLVPPGCGWPPPLGALLPSTCSPRCCCPCCPCCACCCNCALSSGCDAVQCGKAATQGSRRCHGCWARLHQALPTLADCMHIDVFSLSCAVEAELPGLHGIVAAAAIAANAAAALAAAAAPLHKRRGQAGTIAAATCGR